MTKQHFVRFAELVKADLEASGRLSMVDKQMAFQLAFYAASTFAILAKEDNPKFDKVRFFEACGLDTPTLNGRI